MTIQEAYNFLEGVKIEAKKKQEIKVYEKFLDVLAKLKHREFSIDEIQSIETKLDSLNLISPQKNRKKHIKEVLSKFEKYLKDTFSLITQSYYTNMGIGLGSSYGIIFGLVFLSNFERSLGLLLGIVIGMAIGSIIGQYMDTEAQTAGKVL